MHSNRALQEFLTEELLPYFEHKKYVWNSGLKQFIRPTRFGHAGILTLITGSENVHTVQFFIGIRHELVEQRLASLQGTAPYYQSQSYTLLPSIEQIIVNRRAERLVCENKDDVRSVAEMFINFMDMEGFDFLNHYRKIASLDMLFNQNCEVGRRWSNYSYQYSFRAMILAKLRNRSDMDDLYRAHRRFLLERGCPSQIIGKFDANFAQLKTHSFN